jgi:hypothetical protein
MSGVDAYLTGVGICTGIGTTLLFIAVFGFLDIPPGSYLQYRLNVQSTPLRVACFVLAMGFFAAGVWTGWHFSSLALNQQMTR